MPQGSHPMTGRRWCSTNLFEPNHLSFRLLYITGTPEHAILITNDISSLINSVYVRKLHFHLTPQAPCHYQHLCNETLQYVLNDNCRAWCVKWATINTVKPVLERPGPPVYSDHCRPFHGPPQQY